MPPVSGQQQTQNAMRNSQIAKIYIANCIQISPKAFGILIVCWKLWGGGEIAKRDA
jgi:hypothetical protein